MLHKDITEQVLGAYYSVYKEHGYGYLESVYSRSLQVEMQSRGMMVQREVTADVLYKGVNVGVYRADLIVAGKVLLEVKANHALSAADERQVLNYLKSLKLEVALLLNFGPKPEFRRLILSRQ